MVMVIFAFLGLIWTGKNWVNMFMKFVFLAMAISAGIFLGQALGYIVKV
jgi:hypothetical protein